MLFRFLISIMNLLIMRMLGSAECAMNAPCMELPLFACLYDQRNKASTVSITAHSDSIILYIFINTNKSHYLECCNPCPTNCSPGNVPER